MPEALKADYHIHTPRCGHAFGDPAQYVEAAVERGFQVVGFADHFPLTVYNHDGSYSMKPEELDDYLAQCRELADRHSDRIRVLVGAEVDYLPEREAEIIDRLARARLDYRYLSVHFLGGWCFDDPRLMEEWDRRSVDDIYREYYETLIRGVETGEFDVVGHLDIPKIFGRRPTADMTPLLRQLLGAVAANRMFIEVNSSGLRKPVRELYPQQSILELARELGVRLVFGSDAHSPQVVGAGYEEARDAATAAGLGLENLVPRR